jgi:hypothetical protein
MNVAVAVLLHRQSKGLRVIAIAAVAAVVGFPSSTKGIRKEGGA